MISEHSTKAALHGINSLEAQITSNTYSRIASIVMSDFESPSINLPICPIKTTDVDVFPLNPATARILVHI